MADESLQTFGPTLEILSSRMEKLISGEMRKLKKSINESNKRARLGERYQEPGEPEGGQPEGARRAEEPRHPANRAALERPFPAPMPVPTPKAPDSDPMQEMRAALADMAKELAALRSGSVAANGAANKAGESAPASPTGEAPRTEAVQPPTQIGLQPPQERKPAPNGYAAPSGITANPMPATLAEYLRAPTAAKKAWANDPAAMAIIAKLSPD